MRPAAFTACARRTIVAGILVALPAGVASAQVRIVQTNSGGDNIHLIDPSTNTIVKTCETLARILCSPCQLARAYR